MRLDARRITVQNWLHFGLTDFLSEPNRGLENGNRLRGLRRSTNGQFEQRLRRLARQMPGQRQQAVFIGVAYIVQPLGRARRSPADRPP